MIMSNLVHLNEMLSELRQQHQERIDYLESKIAEHEREITQLKNLLVEEKVYDC